MKLDPSTFVRSVAGKAVLATGVVLLAYGGAAAAGFTEVPELIPQEQGTDNSGPAGDGLGTGAGWRWLRARRRGSRAVIAANLVTSRAAVAAGAQRMSMARRFRSFHRWNWRDPGRVLAPCRCVTTASGTDTTVRPVNRSRHAVSVSS